MGVDCAAPKSRWAHPVTLARPLKRAHQSFFLLNRGYALLKVCDLLDKLTRRLEFMFVLWYVALERVDARHERVVARRELLNVSLEDEFKTILRELSI